MTGPALSDVVVLEVGQGAAIAYAGRLLRDLGAQVLKLEPPAGDLLRPAMPRHRGESAFFSYLNAGKLSVELDADDTRLSELAQHADIVFHSLRGSDADALDAKLTMANPGAVVVSLTPYGRSGERAHWRSSEFTEYATGGYGYIAGHPEKEPLALPGHQVEFHAGLHASVGSLAAFLHRRKGGSGQRIEISHQEAMLSDHSWFVTSWTHQGVSQVRTGSIYVPCADGFVYLFNLVPYPGLFVLLERFDLLEDESLADPLVWRDRFPEVLDLFAEWAKTRPKREICHACQELRIAASPVNTMADVATNEQLLARDWFGTTTVGGEEFKGPGFPYKLSRTPCVNPGPAPTLGEHSRVVFEPGFGWANASRSEPSQRAEDSLPLSGLRVLEVTANWAGPICGRHLADLGAEVIKVELATKPATRALAWVADDLEWPHHFNRSGYFNKLNRNKRAICLDLSTGEGRSAFLALTAKSDIVVENNSARAMGNLGLSYEDLRKVNEEIIMCSMSGYGATGPERDFSAYGSNIETASGIASLLGYGPDDFYGTGSFYADPVTGNHGSVAVLAALHARSQGGGGQWIDMSLLEAVTPFFAQPFLQYTVARDIRTPSGNRSEDAAPQGSYRTAGDDCWLAVTICSAADWESLCEVIGKNDLVEKPDLQSLTGRQALHDEIDEAISSWSAELDHNVAADLLQSAGLAAAPIMKNWEVLTDNHLNSRSFFLQISHPEAGTHLWPGFPWKLEKTPGEVRLPAPMFGQHNLEVLDGLAGLDVATVDALYREGVTSDEPNYLAGPGL